MLPNFAQPSVLLFFLIAVGCLGWAMVRGGGPERAGAAVALFMMVVQSTAYGITPPEYIKPDEVAVLTDAIAVVGFGGIALAANRMWPLLAAAAQSLSLLAHIGRLIAPGILDLAYSASKSLPTMLVLVLLVLGTERHRWRMKRYGHYRGWRVGFEHRQDPFDAGPLRAQWRLAVARSHIEYPLALCGLMVLVYVAIWAGRAADLASRDEYPWHQVQPIALALLLVWGLAALTLGLWLRRREDVRQKSRLQAFREAHAVDR